MAPGSRDWLAGAELGDRFTEVRLLHTGARFTIYAARERDTARAVAIKVPDETGGSWLAVVLLAEGDVLAAVGRHPHVLDCYGSFRLADGRPALLLQRCRLSLRERLARGEPLPLPQVVAIGIKLAAALEAVHRQGVLHCDVRPHHVLLTEHGEPVLAGFDESVRMADAATRPALHDVGPHTAPELLEGRQPTSASDVYGLAATLYELVAGHTAFREYLGESPASVILRVLSNPVQPILAPDVPVEISDLLTWALRPEPTDRPPSPAWLAEELGRVESAQGWPRTRISDTQ